MGSNVKEGIYNVDMVFCIDATGSMGNVIDMVKSNALNFYEDVKTAMERKEKFINQLRVRIIAYRDYRADGDMAMLTTGFFNLPDDNENFRKCVQSIVADGGGDEPEDGLEALAYAIKSPWTTEGKKRRQVIVVWTDASTHELGFGKGMPNYPNNMPRNLAELSEWWGDMQTSSEFIDRRAKRLVLFAPDKPGWSLISENWDNVIHYPSQAGGGLEEMDYGTILDTIVNTI